MQIPKAHGFSPRNDLSCPANQNMAEFFNEKCGISGHIPLGSFNAMFNFTGSRQVDAAATKSLAMVGYFIPLYEVKLAKLNLVLHEEIKRAVPYSWDPASLASFIENYGTHIVTSATVGGRDVVYIRQHQSSSLSVSDIENYVKDIGDHRFMDSTGESSAGPLKYKDKDVTVIFRRRGGDDLEQSPDRWAETVRLAPDVINMTFTPIVSLLEGVPGIKHLARAIDLYLECKFSNNYIPSNSSSEVVVHLQCIHHVFFQGISLVKCHF
ncbi:hypothetical protein SLEP1_g7840 [Rubroshorea leprosula]|uniref:MACPF domain-containing protein n=1 Tax=Rubroshorea leprosula TaxID=152421 RepID=A0AAV5I5Y9_9ROSI|nr:hypothetical protein SLEP1_g7840 [Rubroshorea leprosula]